MIILDRPYVSAFMQHSIKELGIPVLDNSGDADLLTDEELKLLDEEAFLNEVKSQTQVKLYCNSENPINWISKNLGFTEIPQKIELFKDKVLFRKLLKGMYPDFYFKEVAFEKLKDIDVSSLPKPLITKPAVGFFSMGVYKVDCDYEWPDVIRKIGEEMEQVKGLYPNEVMDGSRFIIETCIEGDEFAVDAYYNEEGKPVILNIFQHLFSSDKDVSDRLYITSKNIMGDYLERVYELLDSIGKIGNISNFPVHMEIRVDSNGLVVPIEINPMRFAGWCTTDIAYYAYGINVYEFYFHQKEPDWKHILSSAEDKLTCLFLADMPKNVEGLVEGFDYDAFSQKLGCVLEMRKIDYRRYPVFAFAFVRVADAEEELRKLLQMDLREFIRLRA